MLAGKATALPGLKIKKSILWVNGIPGSGIPGSDLELGGEDRNRRDLSDAELGKVREVDGQRQHGQRPWGWSLSLDREGGTVELQQ